MVSLLGLDIFFKEKIGYNNIICGYEHNVIMTKEDIGRLRLDKHRTDEIEFVISNFNSIFSSSRIFSYFSHFFCFIFTILLIYEKVINQNS